MSASVVDVPSNAIRQLDQKVGTAEVVLESDVQDTAKLARLLARILREVATLRRRFAPKRIDFQDYPVGAGTEHTFTHKFGGRVRWWVVDAAGDVPELVRLPSTEDALTLHSDIACVITLRVEEAG